MQPAADDVDGEPGVVGERGRDVRVGGDDRRVQVVRQAARELERRRPPLMAMTSPGRLRSTAAWATAAFAATSSGRRSTNESGPGGLGGSAPPWTRRRRPGIGELLQIAARVAKAVKKKTPTVLEAKMARKGGRLKSGDLAEAVEDGDSVAVREVRRAAHFLGLGLGGLVNVLGPEIVIVGGGVAQALGDPWLDLVRTSARRQILTDPEGKIQIVGAALGDDAAVLGAALLARENLLKN